MVDHVAAEGTRGLIGNARRMTHITSTDVSSDLLFALLIPYNSASFFHFFFFLNKRKFCFLPLKIEQIHKIKWKKLKKVSAIIGKSNEFGIYLFWAFWCGDLVSCLIMTSTNFDEFFCNQTKIHSIVHTETEFFNFNLFIFSF